MALEDEIQNLRDRVIMLENHVKSLQFRAKNVEDKKARNVLSKFANRLVTKKIITMKDHDCIFEQK